MYLVAHPLHPPFGGVAGFQFIGRFDAVGGFRHLFWVTYPRFYVDLHVLLIPDLAQNLDLGKPLEAFERMRIIDLRKRSRIPSAPTLSRYSCLACLPLGSR